MMEQTDRDYFNNLDADDTYCANCPNELVKDDDLAFDGFCSDKCRDEYETRLKKRNEEYEKAFAVRRAAFSTK